MLEALREGPMLLPALLGALVLLLLLRYLTGGLQSAPQSSKGKAPPQKREPRGYTRAEVAQHRSEHDLWLILQNKGSDKFKVYDVTSYIEHHPGGDAILWHAGGDATPGFLGIQHPPTVFELVEEYCIGWLEDP